MANDEPQTAMQALGQRFQNSTSLDDAPAISITGAAAAEDPERAMTTTYQELGHTQKEMFRMEFESEQTWQEKMLFELSEEDQSAMKYTASVVPGPSTRTTYKWRAWEPEDYAATNTVYYKIDRSRWEAIIRYAVGAQANDIVCEVLGRIWALAPSTAQQTIDHEISLNISKEDADVLDSFRCTPGIASGIGSANSSSQSARDRAVDAVVDDLIREDGAARFLGNEDILRLVVAIGTRGSYLAPAARAQAEERARERESLFEALINPESMNKAD